LGLVKMSVKNNPQGRLLWHLHRVFEPVQVLSLRVHILIFTVRRWLWCSSSKIFTYDKPSYRNLCSGTLEEVQYIYNTLLSTVDKPRKKKNRAYDNWSCLIKGWKQMEKICGE
jgi:hypothetical protein